MYVILVYDVAVERNAKVLKLCRRYLHWVQNSVLEGELTEVQLQQLLAELKGLIQDSDSVIVFKFRQERWVDRTILGLQKGNTESIL
ncbi:MAG: CRISPR-associated endonuclease Cas2 [Bacteroidia bacterium]|nr:CRISPR-associated endonuclease Cas2 [Bacteroidia bacterium]